jgi:hypothetical protein
VYACEENNEIVGYAVSSIEKNTAKQKYLSANLSMGNIIDLLTLPNENHASLDLICHMLDYFDHNAVDIVSCWMFKNHPYHSVLSNLGFSEYYELFRQCISRPKYVQQFILYVNSRAAVHEASELKGATGLYWFIMPGDADFV